MTAKLGRVKRPSQSALGSRAIFQIRSAFLSWPRAVEAPPLLPSRATRGRCRRSARRAGSDRAGSTPRASAIAAAGRRAAISSVSARSRTGMVRRLPKAIRTVAPIGRMSERSNVYAKYFECEQLEGALGAHRPGPDRLLHGRQVEARVARSSAWQPVELAFDELEPVLVRGHPQDPLAGAGRGLLREQRHLQLALRAVHQLGGKWLLGGDRLELLGRRGGTRRRRSRAPRRGRSRSGRSAWPAPRGPPRIRRCRWSGRSRRPPGRCPRSTSAGRRCRPCAGRRG